MDAVVIGDVTERRPARYHMLRRGVFDRFSSHPVVPGDPTWQDYQSWIAKGNQPDPEPKRVVPIEEQRIELSAKVNMLRREALAAGVTFDGNVYQSDPASRDNVARWSTFASADNTLPKGFTWRDATDVNRPMDKAALLRLDKAMLEHEHACYVRSWELKEQILASPDPSSIDVNGGWP